MARICTNKDCQREVYLTTDKCPYCHAPVREIVPDIEPPPPTASPKNTVQPVKPWVAPTREEPKLDLGLIMKNAWPAVWLALAAGLLSIRPSMSWLSDSTQGSQFSFRWLDVVCAMGGGFAVMLLVRWRGECRPDSRFWRWVQKELRKGSAVALWTGLTVMGFCWLGPYLPDIVGRPPRLGFEDILAWASSMTWIGVIISWVVRVMEKHRRADPDEQFELGYNYYHGHGVKKDYAEAVKWYRKAAEQGHADAQCNLGYCYDKGKGVEQSYNEAVKWYRKAAEQGEAYAQNNLGVCYEFGQGVEQSYTEALRWYRLSAVQDEDGDFGKAQLWARRGTK